MKYPQLSRDTVMRRELRYRDMQTNCLDSQKALFEYTCLNCGFVFEQVLMMGPRGNRVPASALASKLMSVVWKGYGHSKGICPMCSDVRKDRL